MEEEKKREGEEEEKKEEEKKREEAEEVVDTKRLYNVPQHTEVTHEVFRKCLRRVNQTINDIPYITAVCMCRYY